MAWDDLKEALDMFTSGVKQFQLGRSINQANAQVQEIRASDQAETQKRAQLQQISNGLVMQMAAQGTPASTIDAVRGAMGPQKFANANEMNMQGIATGNQDLQDQAVKQQTFEENPLLQRLKVMQGSKAFQQMMEMNKFQEQQSEFTTKQFQKLSDNLDASKEVRSAFGRGEQVVQQGGRLLALASSVGLNPEGLNKLPPQQVYELASSLAQMVKNGVATKDEVERFAPKTQGMTEAGIQSWLTNKPAPADVGAFAKLYVDAAHREIANAETQREDMVLKRAQGNLRLASRDPDQFKATVAQRLGPEFTKDDVIINDKTKQISIKGTEDALPMAMSALKKAYSAQYSADPAAKQDALKTFQMLGVDPNIPFTMASKMVSYKIRHGMIGPRKGMENGQ